jgi:fido (protein-threonine AMPylation protein)
MFPELAGRIRGPHPDIPANVSFGNRRGVDLEHVRESLQSLDNYLVRLLDQLDEIASSSELSPDEVRRRVLEGGAIVHCEAVRIHPFVNGNGRTARLCINYFLFRYGYRPLPIERPREEYLQAIDAWLHGSDIAPMADLLDAMQAEQSVSEPG